MFARHEQERRGELGLLTASMPLAAVLLTRSRC